jgi:M6 family metalloprotease-like protein
MKHRFFFSTLVMGFFLLSCSHVTSSSLSSLSASGTGALPSSTSSSEPVDPHSPFEHVLSKYSLADEGKSLSRSLLPSTGERSILVIPVTIGGYESNATAETRNDIVATFNGQASETGYESLRSYYSASSFGQLSLHATVTDWFNCGYSAQEIINASSNDALAGVRSILKKAIAWFRFQYNESGSRFDTDGDGYLDAVWLIYSAPDFSKDSTLNNPHKTFWAMTSWNKDEGDIYQPVPSGFSWGSYDFMYRAYGNKSLDAHTYIHETGHLLGLDDYYDYENKCAPMGGVDMMDRNIIDHNAYSKFALGWVSPILATHAGSITLHPSVTTGSCLIIPTSKGWNGSVFDEYLLIEMYAPEGLNNKDSLAPYTQGFPQSFTRYGIRIYHVDARLCIYAGSSKRDYTDELTTTGFFHSALAHSNTGARSKDRRYKLLQLLDHSGVNQAATTAASTSASLWGNDDSFTFASYQNEFPLQGTMNNGYKFSYKITFEYLDREGVTVSLETI